MTHVSGQKKGKEENMEYRLIWRILIAKPEHRSKHFDQSNVASTVTLRSIIDIPQ